MLKVKRVAEGPQGKTVETKYATKTAVITDFLAETAEVIEVNEVRIMAMLISEIDQVFQANFVIGGLDSKGVFHRSPEHAPALLAINKAQFEDWWAENIEGRTVYDYAEVLTWIHQSGAVSEAGKNLWKMPGLVSYYEGEPDPAPPPPVPGPAEKEPGVIPPSGPFPPMPVEEDAT